MMLLHHVIARSASDEAISWSTRHGIQVIEIAASPFGLLAMTAEQN
jgi:hypothetical protein